MGPGGRATGTAPPGGRALGGSVGEARGEAAARRRENGNRGRPETETPGRREDKDAEEEGEDGERGGEREEKEPQGEAWTGSPR